MGNVNSLNYTFEGNSPSNLSQSTSRPRRKKTWTISPPTCGIFYLLLDIPCSMSSSLLWPIYSSVASLMRASKRCLKRHPWRRSSVEAGLKGLSTRQDLWKMKLVRRDSQSGMFNVERYIPEEWRVEEKRNEEFGNRVEFTFHYD